MAYIRSHETAIKRKGKVVKRYEVVWREPHPVTGQIRGRQESYTTREAAEVRRDELNAAKHTVGGTAALADAKKAGAAPLCEYVASWLDAQAVHVANGDLKAATAAKYRRLLEFYVLPELGGTPVAQLTTQACRKYRAALVSRGSRVGDRGRLSAGTVGHVWRVLRAVLDQAVADGAIPSNPAAAAEFRRKRGTGDQTGFKHNPLTAEQVGRLSAAVAGELPDENGNPLPAYPVYALMVEFMAYTGLRASEVAGLQVSDIAYQPAPAASPTAPTSLRAVVRVSRAIEHKGGVAATRTLKTANAKRTVPLPGWLAERMADYLAAHPNADDPTAPLWPGRSAEWVAVPGDGKRRQNAHDWATPVDMGSFYRRVFRPALAAVGLPVSRPARAATKTAPARPAAVGVRLHDLRHTFAAQQLTAGTPFMQVSQWLGHADYVVTMRVYAEWLPAEAAANTLPEPPRKSAPAANATPANVFALHAG